MRVSGSARRSTDLEEVGAGLVAAVELRYPDPGDAQADGHLLTVAVGTGFEFWRTAPT